MQDAVGPWLAHTWKNAYFKFTAIPYENHIIFLPQFLLYLIRSIAEICFHMRAWTKCVVRKLYFRDDYGHSVRTLKKIKYRICGTCVLLIVFYFSLCWVGHLLGLNNQCRNVCRWLRLWLWAMTYEYEASNMLIIYSAFSVVNNVEHEGSEVTHTHTHSRGNRKLSNATKIIYSVQIIILNALEEVARRTVLRTHYF